MDTVEKTYDMLQMKLIDIKERLELDFSLSEHQEGVLYGEALGIKYAIKLLQENL